MKAALRVLVVDDEPPARRRLLALIARRSGTEVAGEAADGPAAVEAIGRLAPDVVLLDVEMPGMSGLEVVAAVGAERMPAVVFVTAYDDYAVAAFELEAVDYVTKPVEPERLGRALDRAARRIAAERQEALLRLLERSASVARGPARLLVQDGDRAYFVPLDEVSHLAARGNYVELHAGGRRHLVRDTLARLERTLDPGRFVRIHRSTIVNLDRVRELQPLYHGDWVAILDDGTKLRVSRRYRDGVLRDR